MEASKRLLGAEHPNTPTDIGNLAEICSNLETVEEGRIACLRRSNRVIFLMPV
jgi:hypothetical protein